MNVGASSVDDAGRAVPSSWTTRRRMMAAGFAFVAPCGATAATAGRIATIGYLAPGSADSPLVQASLSTFRAALGELGWREGVNLVIERRWGEFDALRLAGAAQELVDRRVDVIVAGGGGGTVDAARRATSRIPIVVVIGLGLVESGLVHSLPRPGTNVTGMVWEQGVDIMGKYPELLREVMPGLKRLGGLYDATAPSLRPYREELVRIAGSLGITIIHADVQGPDQVEAGVQSLAAWHAQAMLVYGSTTTITLASRIAALAAKHRIADMHVVLDAVRAGGLMSYGKSVAEFYRLAASYVDRILRGKDPADLPIEQPSKYELGLNLRTARALGLSIPVSLRVRADEVVE